MVSSCLKGTPELQHFMQAQHSEKTLSIYIFTLARMTTAQVDLFYKVVDKFNPKHLIPVLAAASRSSAKRPSLVIKVRQRSGFGGLALQRALDGECRAV